MCGIGIRQLSRTAAITALLTFVLAQIAARRTGIMTALLGLLLFHAVRAAIAAPRVAGPGGVRGIANPDIELTGVARVLEYLPGRVWPRLRVVFLGLLVVLAAMVLLQAIVVVSRTGG
jgi:hypothetical protein